MVKHFFFIPTLNYRSGWGTVSINYLKSLNKNEVIILCNKKNNDFDFDQFEILHPPLDYLKNPALVYLDYLKLKKILKKYNKIKLYSHFPCEPYSLILFFAYNFFYKNIYYAQGSYTLILASSFRTKFLFSYVKNYFYTVVYSSKFTKTIINKNEKFLNSKKVVINPFIFDNKKNSLTKQKFKKETIISVGHLTSRKGQDILIKIINFINKKYNKQINLLLVGSSYDSKFRIKINNLIKSYNLKKQVKIVENANTKKLENLYLRSSIFILLSKIELPHFEGFGIVNLEAIKFGLPIIISKESGAMDMLNYFKKIKSFNPNDLNKISVEIVNLLKKKYKFNTANKKILKTFNRKNEFKLKKLYKKLN